MYTLNARHKKNKTGKQTTTTTAMATAAANALQLASKQSMLRTKPKEEEEVCVFRHLRSADRYQLNCCSGCKCGGCGYCCYCCCCVRCLLQHIIVHAKAAIAHTHARTHSTADFGGLLLLLWRLSRSLRSFNGCVAAASASVFPDAHIVRFGCTF